MNYITDAIQLGKTSVKETLALIKKVPHLLWIPIVHLSAMLLVMRFIPFMGLGMLNSLLTGLLMAGILSSYFYLLHQGIYYKRLKWRDVTHGIKVYALEIWIALLVLNLVNYAINLVGFNQIPLPIVNLMIFILFNPLPEVIYLSEYAYNDLFFYNFAFIRRNWLPWFLLNGVLWLLLAPLLLLGSFIPAIFNILMVVYLSFAMLFRGFLFKSLHSSNYRKRRFNQYNR
ncbi:MAG: hypothetical protein AVO33_07345 [delta proteobacterium ML8_F1]|nr:MAG: hypothetical protein AVO33_07345 [delta proteobacterium ML8_F1]